MSACDTCAAPCCREYFVAIDAWDVYRIANGARLPASDFVELRQRDHSDPDFRIILDGTVAPEDRTRFYCLTLGKVRDENPKYEERCVFLMAIGERGRCGIYGIRPSVCRVYPTNYHAGVITTDGGGRFCPPGAWHIEGLEVSLFRTRWNEHRLHRWIQQELVDGWNERVIALRLVFEPKDFLAYILRFYATLEEREAWIFAERPHVAWPMDKVKEAVDRTLRAMDWRTDETRRCADPLIGWVTGGKTLLGGEEVLVLDPDEEIDPWGSKMRARLPSRAEVAEFEARVAAEAAGGERSQGERQDDGSLDELEDVF